MGVGDPLCHTSEKLNIDWGWIRGTLSLAGAHVIPETGKEALQVTVMSKEGIRADVSKYTLLREVLRLVSLTSHFYICPLVAAELPSAHWLMALWLKQSPIKV